MFKIRLRGWIWRICRELAALRRLILHSDSLSTQTMFYQTIFHTKTDQQQKKNHKQAQPWPHKTSATINNKAKITRNKHQASKTACSKSSQNVCKCLETIGQWRNIVEPLVPCLFCHPSANRTSMLVQTSKEMLKNLMMLMCENAETQKIVIGSTIFIILLIYFSGLFTILWWDSIILIIWICISSTSFKYLLLLEKSKIIFMNFNNFQIIIVRYKYK